MLGYRIERHGGIETLCPGDLPRPVPGPGEVAVRLQAAGLNHLDIWVRRGVPGHRFPLPLVPGSDGTGVVEQCGPGVIGRALGDPVILSPGVSCGTCAACLSGKDPLCASYGILGETRDGTCAEFVVVPACNLVDRPATISTESAACFVLSALTAWTMLTERAEVRPGEEVLVLAGASGVGAMAIQLARLQGCRVIATAGSDAKCSRLLELGAHEVIHHGQQDVAQTVRALTNKRGVDVVIEHVGAALWEAAVRSLRKGGRLVTCGATSGAEVTLNLRQLFFKSISFLGSTMGSKGAVPLLVDLLARGAIQVPIARVLPLTRLADAHALLEQREAIGKVVILHDQRA